jgi:hypothetical protein
MSNDNPARRLAQATLERAQVLWEMGNRELALKDFQEAYITAPDLAGIPYSHAIHQMGAEKQAVNDLDGAMADFQLARELAPEGDWRSKLEANILALDQILHPDKSEPSIIVPSICPQCGKETLTDWKFCPYCNTDLQVKPFVYLTKCFNCGEQLEQGWEYCPYCSTSLKPRSGEELGLIGNSYLIVKEGGNQPSIPEKSELPSELKSSVSLRQASGSLIDISNQKTLIPKRSGCLSLWLAAAIVGNALMSLFSIVLLFDPTLVSGKYQAISYLGILLNVTGIGFAVGIARWKRWGVYGYVCCVLIVMLLNLSIGQYLYFFQGFLPLGLLAYLLQPYWKYMK